MEQQVWLIKKDIMLEEKQELLKVMEMTNIGLIHLFLCSLQSNQITHYL